MILELSRYLLRAIASRPGEVKIEHIHANGVDFLFLSMAQADRKGLSERDKDALTVVIEHIGKKLGREVIVDWR